MEDKILELKKELLQKRIDKAIESKEHAGVSLLWVKDGEELAFLSAGKASIERDTDMKRDTIVHLYSQSKPVTAAAMMLLMQDGIIDLYDPVEKYIPGFANPKVQTIQGPVTTDVKMTLRDLLNMTSGLVYGGDRTKAETDTGAVFEEIVNRLDTDHAMTTAEFGERIGRCTLQFVPGTSWQYGVSADICGAVIEKAADMRFGEFLKKRLFEPLGMTDTGFSVPEEKKERLASIYVYHGPEEGMDGEKKAAPGSLRAAGSPPDEVSDVSLGYGPEVRAEDGAYLTRLINNHLGVRSDGGVNPFESGGAGLFSTIDDYMKFAGMLLNGGKAASGESILRPGTIEFMTTHQLEAPLQNEFSKWIGLDGFSYGNFCRVMQDRRMAGIIGSNGEYGWDGWLGTYFCNDPANHQTILMNVQRKDYGTGTMTRELRNIIFS